MSRLEDMITETKLYEMLRKRDEDKLKKGVLWGLAIIGAVAAIAGIGYAIYRFFTPDYLEDFEEEFEEDFEDSYFEEDEL